MGSSDDPSARVALRLDADVAAALRELAGQRGISFDEVVNSTLRAGLRAEPEAQPYETPTRALRLKAEIDLDRALQLAAALEDEEIVRTAGPHDGCSPGAAGDRAWGAALLVRRGLLSLPGAPLG